VTEQPQTPEDASASRSEGEVETTQAGVAPTEDAVAPLPEDAPPPPTAVEPPAPPPPPPMAPPPPPSSFATDSGPSVSKPDRPEIPIAGAFVGGVVLALILKRLAR
jgi:hypothetical protein